MAIFVVRSVVDRLEQVLLELLNLLRFFLYLVHKLDFLFDWQLWAELLEELFLLIQDLDFADVLAILVIWHLLDEIILD